MLGSNDKQILTLFIGVVIVLSVGGILSSMHISYGYSSELSEIENGLSYKVGGGAPAEYNILLSENTSSVEKVYLYFDPAYGTLYNDGGKFVKNISNRLSDRGFANETIDTVGLKQLLSESPIGVGLMISSGAIPEDVADGTLLKWVQSGGTLYWTFNCIGLYGARSDGTVYSFDRSYQSDFLGSDCTSLNNIVASNYETTSGYTTALSLTSTNLFGGLISSAITNPHLSIGFTKTGVYGTTLISCGSGMVAVVSGNHDVYQKTDIVQLICSGITVDSKLIEHKIVKTGLGKMVDGEILFTKVPGTKYVIYVYTSGINPAYGKTMWVIA